MKELTTWFLKLSTSGKGLVIVSFLWVLTYQVMSIKLSLSNNALINQIQEEKEIVSEKIVANEENQDSLVEKGTTEAVKHKIAIKNINLKSKEDAKKIDDSDYPIAKLDSLLASYD